MVSDHGYLYYARFIVHSCMGLTSGANESNPMIKHAFSLHPINILKPIRAKPVCRQLQPAELAVASGNKRTPD